MGNPIKAEFDIAATMRDGTILRANIFRPQAGGPHPVLLTRTPYGKDFFSTGPILDAVRMAREGYIVVIQDVRGRFASEGEWSSFQDESLDGYDSVEWAAALSDSNGNVGMYGLSYLGFTQWMAAKLRPPHLKAIMPAFTWANLRDGGTWRDGALELGTLANWQLSAIALNNVMRRDRAKGVQTLMQSVAGVVNEVDRLRDEGYWSLPLKDFAPLARVGVGMDTVAEVIGKPYDRAQSDARSIGAAYDDVQVPSFNVGGWYDIFQQGTLDNYSALRTGGSTPEARQAKVLIGPWSHVNYSHVSGQQDFGFASSLAFMNMRGDLTMLTQRWFDYWLKGIDNGIMREPPVRIFVMGSNTWRDEEQWPPAGIEYTPCYLRAGGGLSTQIPGDEEPDRYVYDPANPVPTKGGAILMNATFVPGVVDQRALDDRSDLLRYQTEPLRSDVEVIGPVKVVLWACTDAKDTDFVARLIDVHPSGFAQNLTDGIVRGRYRNGDTPELLEAGKPYEFTIDLWSTANLFRAGHRIRLDVTSSNFPRWDRNPNTSEAFGVSAAMQPAQQTILHDTAHLSRVVLPIVGGADPN